jgi:RND family efflux transporter MFP subunit
MNLRTLLISGIVGMGLLGATVFQARAVTASRPLAPAARPARGTPQGVAAEGRVVTYTGAEVIVGAERTGRLVRVAVEEGQSVARGQLLAELESDELRASLAEAESQQREAEAELRLAELSLQRRQELAQLKVVSAHELDQATRDVDITRARLETARASVARYRAQLRKTQILAPIAGTVVARHVDAGETVESGSRIATLADLSRLRIEGEADEADVAGLKLGQSVAITSEAYPGRSWDGRVEELADSVTLRKLKPQDPGRPTDTRILAFKVAFAEPTPLRLGTTVELRIRPAEKN